MGPGLAGYRQPLRLGLADEGHALLGGDMAHVVPAAGLPHQLQIPLHLFPLALRGVAGEAVPLRPLPVVDAPAGSQQGLVLTVGSDGLVQLFCEFHGIAHLVGGLDAFPVVGEAADKGLHSRHVRQLRAFFAPGDGPIGIHPHPAVPGDGVQLRPQVLQGVRHRIQVGHGAHRRVASCGGRRRAGGDGFLIRKSRLPKMNMYINETWNNDLILTFNYGKTFLGKGGRNGNNTAFGNGNIHILESSIPENSPAGQQEIHGYAPSSASSFDILS